MLSNQLYRGSLITIIMQLLEREGKMYGCEITQKVKDITQGAVDIKEGALYPTLHKLQADGLLLVEAQKVDNRIRKYYTLSPQGKKESINLLADLKDYIESMQAIVQPKLSY
jgi:DNA-binding PadR family transcriptional regulator